jgi:Na+/melibiose symporter-like transporter
VWRGFVNAVKLKSFRGLFLGLLIMYIFGGTQGVLAVHMNTYYWGLNPEQAQFIFYAQMVGFIVGIPLARPLAATFDKKWSYMSCVGGSCIVVSIPVFMRLAGWFPPNGDPIVLQVVTATNFAYGIIGASSGILSAAMLADIADEYELKNGDRAEGLFFGAVAFSSKASIGLGGAFAGILLDVIHFPRTPGVTVIAPDILWHLGFVYGPVLLLILLLGLMLVLPYDLNRTRHHEILEELNRRRAARKSG